MSRISFDDFFMEIARITAGRSTCWKHQVGAVLVCANRIVSTGYNGAASGRAHCFDAGPRDRVAHRKWSRDNEVHAELNAILYSRRATGEMTLYTTLAPCLDCAEIIRLIGVVRVVYSTTASCSLSGIYFLKACGVVVEQA